jgi:hypothetical protein
MTEQAPDSIWSGINIPKTIAGALAAVCAAVIGSFLGVAGTLIGAAVASVIGSVGTEIYERSLKHGARKLQTLTPAFVKVPAAVGTPPVEAASDEESPSHTVPPRKTRIRWPHVALVAAAVFVVAMGAISVVELIAHRSVASLVGNDTGASSTFGGITHPGPKATPAPAPTPNVTPTSTGGPATPTSTAPTTTTTTVAPSTVAPTSVAPEVTSAPPRAPDAPRVQNTQ